MKQRVTKLGGLLLVLLITGLLAALAGSGLVVADRANPVRDLPAQVKPGDLFQVTVTFTSPANNLNAIGLADIAPAGWNVSVNKIWCTPAADVDNKPTDREANYIWYGPFAAGAAFTAVYKVQVPTGAALGTYNFTRGTLEYYVGTAGPYVVSIAGDYEVQVVAQPTPPPVGGTAYLPNKLLMVLPWIALGAAIVVATRVLMRRRHSAAG